MSEDSWGGADLDLEAYLVRIEYRGDLAHTAETLRALQRAHVLSVPWDNLDMVLRRPVRLDVEGLQDKLVRQRRGGTCSEHTTLFAAALERLGFRPTGMSGRVQMGATKIRPATHGLLRVPVEDQVWLCDVGFGGSPLEPVELTDGAESKQDDWHYALAWEADRWVLRSRRGGEWLTVHTFTEDRRYPVDYAVTNHYVATNPRSPFSGRVMAQRVTPEAHLMLENTRLTTTRPERAAEVQDHEPAEIVDVLADVFRVHVASEDASAVLEVLSAIR
jgi:N-hydroxyarylamine O-acetyltransferase